MGEAQQTEAEIKRLSDMSADAFTQIAVDYVMGGTDHRTPRAALGAALASPELAVRTLEALEKAGRETRTYLPRKEGESKRDYQARTVPFRHRLQMMASPLQDVIEDLAADETDFLAQLDDDAFAQEWVGFVLDRSGRSRPIPRRIQGLAFRSLKVAPRAAALARKMLEEPAAFLPPAEGEGRKAHRARIDQLRSRVESEARFLQYALQYAEARQGRMPSAPNVRLQALRLLGEAHPEELSKLINMVRADGRAARDEVRRQKRAARRASAKGAP